MCIVAALTLVKFHRMNELWAGQFLLQRFAMHGQLGAERTTGSFLQLPWRVRLRHGHTAASQAAEALIILKYMSFNCFFSSSGKMNHTSILSSILATDSTKVPK